MKTSQKDNPRVSVVIPLFDKAAFIKATLESVLAQTMGDFEVLVVDDSRDEGPSIARSLGDERIQVVHYSDRGISAARNHGLSISRSDLVAFLDADDLWQPRFLETMVDALERHAEAVAAFCAFGEGAGGRTRMPRLRGEIVIGDYPAWFIRRGGRGLWSSNNLVRKAALQQAGLFPEGVRNGEDTDTWFRLSFEGPVLYVPELLARYVPDEAGSANKKAGPQEPFVIRSIQAALGSGKLGASSRASALAAIDYFRIAYASALAMRGRRKEALAAARSARFRPRLWRAFARAIVAYALGR
jgi:glycosyltransferase involved in cell wall biosynthesis